MKRFFGSTRNFLLVLALIGSLLLGYFVILPVVAEQVASVIPRSSEKVLGDAVYQALQEDSDSRGSALLSSFFDSMHIKTPYEIRIALVNDKTVNAFALPGGQLVVYTGLLKKMKSYSELAALLSHEFIHVEKRHATRSICRSLGSQFFIGLLFGNMGSVVSVAAGHADELRTLSYSRSLEKEADLSGLQLLLDRGIDAKGFADLFNHLKQAESSLVLPEIISSHPDTDDRAAYIKKAATGQQPVSHPSLNHIFDTLKKSYP
ncbi:MAG: M48 family metallopeptidase [Sphingomonadales bacterium]